MSCANSNQVLHLAVPDASGRPSQPLALLTRTALPELPSFFLHFGIDRHSSVSCISIKKPVSMVHMPSLLVHSHIFTSCIFSDVFSKLYNAELSKWPYFLVPIQTDVKINPDAEPSDLIAWEILKSVFDYQNAYSSCRGSDDSWRTKPDDFFADRFVTDSFDGSRKLWLTGITHDYRPLDPVPGGCALRKGARKSNKNILEYSNSMWKGARAKLVDLDPEQRVYKAEVLPLRRNLLDEFNTPTDEESAPTKCYVTLQMLSVSPLPTTVVAMALAFPAIIYRLESYLIALEACELLHLNISPTLALEAMTKDSDNTDEHNPSVQQINFQRGMGNNYERLEFLGDCFLKMAVSISLYGESILSLLTLSL